MPDKTKATLPGSQSINSKRIEIQITTMIGLVNLDTGIPVSVSVTDQSGEALPVTHSHAQKILKGSLVGAGYKASLSASRASLRWRRLISFWIAEFINCPVLSPSTLTCCIPSINSCVIRAVTDCDLAFFEPVAMSTFSDRWCKTIYTSLFALKELTCKTPVIYRVSYTFLVEGVEIAKPGSASTLTGPLTKPLVEVTIMAELQSTQTRPEFTYDTKFFTWRFLAVPVSHHEARPIVLYTNVHTEAEARQSLPGWLLFFAARLPLFTPEIKGVNHA